MSEIKVSLTIEIPGNTMFSKEECLKIAPKTVVKKDKDGKFCKKSTHPLMKECSMKVTDKNGANPKIITFNVRKCKPAIQTLNICKEAYDDMVSAYSCPSWSKPNKWITMSKEERLDSHMKRIAEHFNGISYTYNVFVD